MGRWRAWEGKDRRLRFRSGDYEGRTDKLGSGDL